MAPPHLGDRGGQTRKEEDRDVDDFAYLIEAKRIDLTKIRSAVLGIPDENDRRTAEEKMVLLSVLDPASDGLEPSDRSPRKTDKRPSR